MRPPNSAARTCNRPGCDVQIIFATRVDTHRTVPYEADDVDPNSNKAGLCHVIVNGRAWKAGELAEQFRVQFELPSLDKARQLVREYPHHRPHFHLPEPEGDTP